MHWLIVVAVLLCGCSGYDAIEISALTLNDAPPGAAMRAGYLTLTNHGDKSRRLVSVTSNAFTLAEIHRTETVDGIARMRAEDMLIIAGGERVVFEPFGRHVMLMRPLSPPLPDAQVSVTLCFDDESCVVATAASQ